MAGRLRAGVAAFLAAVGFFAAAVFAAAGAARLATGAFFAIFFTEIGWG